MLTYPPLYGSLPIGAVAPPVDPLTLEGAFQRVLLLSPYDSDRATLTASTAVSSLPVANLQNQEPGKVWRTTSAIDQYVDLVFPEPLPIDAMAVAWPDIPARPSSALVQRLQLFASADDVGITPAADSGWQSIWPQGYRHASPSWGPEVSLLKLANTGAHQYARAWFSDPAAGAAYIDPGRLAVGRAVQFTVNVGQTLGTGFLPNDVVESNGWGQIFTDPRPANRTFNLPWEAMGQREALTVAAELSRLRGLGGDVFCFLEPHAVELFHTFSMQGLFNSRHDYQAQPLQVTDMDGTLRFAWGVVFQMIQKR